jgi:hypothetical protein
VYPTRTLSYTITMLHMRAIHQQGLALICPRAAVIVFCATETPHLSSLLMQHSADAMMIQFYAKHQRLRTLWVSLVPIVQTLILECILTDRPIY